ncbi:MAG: redoxin domain-containing protein [Thermosulfidibacteraceae bacterium]|jgi:peroxiredoxin
MSIGIGEVVPDFKLKDQNNEVFTLSEFRGKKVLLSFHPLSWTPVCAKQVRSLEENYEKFLSLNTIPVSLSVDPVPSKKAWAEYLKIKKLRLLSDFWPHGHVASIYKVFREKDGFSERANVIVDEEGKIVFVKIYPIREVPNIEEILEFLRST